MTGDSDPRIVQYHVGGRAGSTSLAIPAAFAADVSLVLFEADESCVALSETMGKRTYADTTSLPYFIGRRDGEVRFLVNYDPFTSSSYRLNPSFADYYALTSGVDYVFGETIAPVREVAVAARSLDSLCTGAEADMVPPDILTLDTQGSELDILEGAARLLDDEVVAVVAETQLNEVYLGAAMFGDVSAFLRGKGFLFAEFSDMGRYAPLRGRIGARSEGLCLQADAVFLRDPHRIAKGWGDRAPGALRKLAFVALCVEKLEFAQLCLDLAGPATADAERPAYLRFLADFAAAAAGLPEPRPWTYAEAYSPEASRALTEPASEAAVERIKAEMAAKAAREAAKLAPMAAGAGAVADVLERWGFASAARVRRFQELVIGAYRESVSHWASMPRTPSNDRGEPPR